MSVTPNRGDRRISLDELRATMAQITDNMRAMLRLSTRRQGKRISRTSPPP